MRLEDFDNHVFISYTHGDNDRLGDFEKLGWVENFEAEFTRRLKALLPRDSGMSGRELKIWRDSGELQGNTDFDEEIKSQIRRSVCLIAIMSRNYLDSKYCQLELSMFGARAEEQGWVKIEGNRWRALKALKVSMRPEEFSILPDYMQKALGFNFFTDDRELRPAYDPKEQLAFVTSMSALAKEVADILVALSEGIDPDQISDKGAVYLAESTQDVAKERSALRTYLLDNGYTVLPNESLPRSGEEFEAKVQEDLARCRLSIHTVGSTSSAVLEGASCSTFDAQLALARKRCEDGKLEKPLVWLPPDLEPEDRGSSQAKLLERLRTDPELNASTEMFLGATLEAIETHAIDRLEPPEAEAEEGTASAGANGAAKTHELRVGIICERADEALIDELYTHLEDVGHYPDIVEVGEDGLQKEQLEGSDAFLVCWGEADEAWIRPLRRSLKEGSGERPWAIFVGGEESPAKAKYKAPGSLVLRHFGEFTPDALEEFVQRLGATDGGDA